MRCGIIIVNYNTANLVADCLDSLASEISPGQDCVVVVDNNSQDGSCDTLQKFIQKKQWNWVTLLPLSRNRGFSAGNNAGIRLLQRQNQFPQFIWLLNPDTIVQKGAHEYLISFLQSSPQAGVAGSRLEDPDGTPQVSAFRHHSPISELLSGLRIGIMDKLFAKRVVPTTPISITPHKTDWVAGASMMIRKEVIERIGLLDENYFLYYEEEDYCKQATDNGWECWYVPSSRVIHLVGAASGISDHRKKAPRRPTYWFESRRRFFMKNYGLLTLFLADTCWLAGYSIWRLRRWIQRKPDLDPPFFLLDFFRWSVFCKGGKP